MRNIAIYITLFISTLFARADSLDSLYTLLRDHPQIQENIYVQLDNQCYFVGDTIWYKAFVLKADSLKPEHYSRILYVELLTPDGYLVERQTRIINGGVTNGQFFLEDSLYSGYYEIRAYTRWDLNFNVEEREHSTKMYAFFSKDMEDDYFREFPGLYSRVVPIFEKPRQTGDFADQRIVPRPKQRIYTEKPKLKVTFYPEGGSLVVGMKSRVAYEVTDEEGLDQDVLLVLPDGKGSRPSFQGRGVFEYTPTSTDAAEIHCNWNNEKYSFKLPKAQENGAVISYDVNTKTATISAKSNTTASCDAAVTVLCRGRLYHFERFTDTSTLNLNKLSLPTGINDITIYNSDAQPLASRLVFINKNDKGIKIKKQLTTGKTTITDSTKIQPYAPVELSLASSKTHSLCVAVYENKNLPLTFDDNNIMTSLLLSGELRGFIPNPSYYFESNDKQHTTNLDLLMMVQGWRKYKRVDKFRYLPELKLTYDGQVFKVPSDAEIVDISDVSAPTTEFADITEHTEYVFVSAVGHRPHYIDNSFSSGVSDYQKYQGYITDNQNYCPGSGLTDYINIRVSPSHNCIYDNLKTDFAYYEQKRNTKSLSRKEIKVEAELVVGKEIAGIAVPIDSKNHFHITMPWFYGNGTLFVTAYKQKDSLKMNLGSLKDKQRLDETAYPDYYVKRDVFFPMFCKPYSWYQINSPEDFEYIDPTLNKEMALSNNHIAGDHYLSNVTIKRKRKSKNALDYKKPAIKVDAYQLYNDITDYGLSYGVLDMNRFTQQASVYLFGYLDQNSWVKIKGLTDSIAYFRNYFQNPTERNIFISKADMLSRMRMSRMNYISAYSDYDKRKGIRLEHDGQPAVTIRIETFPNEGRQITFRDRHYLIEGITYPEEFYNYDYSKMKPKLDADGKPTDYRRTLYWNPDVKLNKDGTFHTTLYNNSRLTSVKVTVAGIDSQGRMYW